MNFIYRERRMRLMDNCSGPCLTMLFSGKAPKRSADEAYGFSVDRSFFYLTGLDRENMILVLQKDENDLIRETVFIEPYDEFLAKWVGGRMRAEEVSQVSGISNVRNLEEFADFVTGFMEMYRGMGRVRVYLDLWKYELI